MILLIQPKYDLRSYDINDKVKYSRHYYKSYILGSNQEHTFKCLLERILDEKRKFKFWILLCLPLFGMGNETRPNSCTYFPHSISLTIAIQIYTFTSNPINIFSINLYLYHFSSIIPATIFLQIILLSFSINQLLHQQFPTWPSYIYGGLTFSYKFGYLGQMK